MAAAKAMDEDIRRRLLAYQRNEITEYQIYRRLARAISPDNARILELMAQQELGHYGTWKRYTGRDVAPSAVKVWFFYYLSRVLGFTFGVKLLERWEQRDQHCYEQLNDVIPEADSIRADECEHEAALLDMLDERRLRYTSSIVLGLSDALVELTGALAGLTLALQSTRLVAATGLMTGMAAALSMAASSYLSTRAAEDGHNPLRAAIYTGLTYLITVLILVCPYLLAESALIALATTLLGAMLVIAAFNYYIAVAKGLDFRRRFLEMAGLSLGVAAVSFLLGLFVRRLLGIEI